MLSPKKMKFRKAHKGRIKGVACSGHYLAYGSYGLKALSAGWIGAGAFDPRGRAVPVAKSFGAYFLPETR